MTKPQVTIPLEIPDVQVLKSEINKAGELIITVESTKETGVCQRCGRVIRKFHGYDDWVKLRYLPVFGHPTYLRYRPKRYRCEYCDGQPTSSQRLDWHEPNSPNAFAYEQHILLQLVNSTIEDVAVKEGFSYASVLGIIERYISDKVDWSQYKVKNWSEYDKALVQRGSIIFWLSDNFEQSWQYTGAKQCGAPFDYSDQAIIIMQTIKNVFQLSNRAAEGFVSSIFAMLQVFLCVPDHTTLSRRGKDLKIVLPKKTSGHVDIVMDSTGLKIYGEGEWKVRTHGKSKRRTWRKLHVGVDPQSGEIQAAALTENSISDAAMAEPLLEQIEQPIDHFAADGSYDKRRVYDSLNQHAPNAEVLIPPRKNARIWQHGNTKADRLKRDENLRFIRQHGRKDWKQASGYHVRSLAETTMFRLKTIFGDQLSARLLETQTTQALIRCAALNRMTHLGMPDTHKVA